MIRLSSTARARRIARGAVAAFVFAAGCAAPRHFPPPAGSGGASTPVAAREAPGATPSAVATPTAAVDRSSAPAPSADAAEGVFARIGDRAFGGDEVARAFFRDFRRQAFVGLNRLVVNELVRQEAERSGMNVPAAKLAADREKAFAELAQEAVAAYGKGTDVAKYLALEFKETPAQWAKRKEAELRDQWLRDRVIRLQSMRQDRVEIQLIAVRDEALAREIASKLDQGADFAALANAHSIHESASAGGRLPPVARDSLNPALADRAFSLPEGARSGVLVVEDQGGGRQYDVLRVLRRRPARPGTWAELAAEVEDGLAKDPITRFEFLAWQLSAFKLYNVSIDDSL